MGRRDGDRLLMPAGLLALAALTLGRSADSLWRDEATSVWFARLPLPQLWAGLCDPHPAGYYLLLKTWLAGGQAEFWLRWPSFLAAMLAVALTYRLGLALGGRSAGLLAGLLLALHPLQSWYAGEARMYAPVQGLGLLLVWLGWRLIHGRPALPQMAVYGLAAVATLGLDYSGLLALALLQFLWLAAGRPWPGRWLALQAISLLLAGLVWLRPGQVYALSHAYPAVLLAVQAGRLGLELSPAAGRWLALAPLLAGLGLAWAGLGPLRRCLDRPAVAWPVVAGWLLLLGLAALPRGYTLKRQVVVVLPYLALLAAYGLGRLPRPVGSSVLALGLAMTALVLPGHPREPWRDAVTGLVRAAGPEAITWVDDLAVPAFAYYLPAGDSLRWAPLVGRRLPRLPELAPRPGRALWLVTSDSPYRSLAGLLPAGFDRQYQLLDFRVRAGIGLYHYRRRAADAGPEAVPARPDPWGLLPQHLQYPVPAVLGRYWASVASPLDTCRAEE